MTRAPKIYRRLPGSGSTALNHVTLYLASDHLLQVSSGGFQETYRRFFFRDIQLISLHRTAASRIWNGVLGGLAGLFALLALAVEGSGAVTAWAIAATWTLLLAFNLAAGPSCACFVQTAVQRQRLHSLVRLRRARQFFSQLKPLIAAAQGELSREELASRLDPARSGPSSPGTS